MVRKIAILDTTLRDGEQSPGFTMNLVEKVSFAVQLDALGVDVIEAGFAAASPEDAKAVSQIGARVKNATVAAFARANVGDIAIAAEALSAAKKPRIHLFLATSDIHLKHKLNMTRQQVLEKSAEGVKLAKTFVKDVQFSAEDAFRTDWQFLAKVYEKVIEAGATVINVTDTVGYATPREMAELITFLRANVKGIDNVTISAHCHNDLGMAVANTFAAMEAGADQLECAVNGIGERAGNASLEEIVMGIKTRVNYYDADTSINTKEIYRTSRLLQTLTGIQVPPNKAIVGENAFAHEAGIHQHGVLKNPATYEIIDPETVGIVKTNLVLGKHSGKHALESRLKELDYKISGKELERIFERFKILAEKKKEISDRDIEALLSNEKIEVPQVYSLEEFVVNSGTTIPGTAMIKLRRDDETLDGVAVGSGPIDASFKAIEQLTCAGGRLDSYSIHSVTRGKDALGEVVVKLSSPKGQVTGRGLSTDIIEASILAYLNGVNKLLAL